MIKRQFQFLIFLLLATGLQAQVVQSINNSVRGAYEKVVINLDKPLSAKTKIKIIANVVEIPFTDEPAVEIPTKLGGVSLYSEGRWLKLVFPEDIAIKVERMEKPAQVIVIGMDLFAEKESIYSLISQKKYKEGITKVRVALKHQPEDGEFWYIGGMIRKDMKEPNKAQINFAKAKKFGYNPDLKSTPKAKVEVKTEEPTGFDDTAEKENAENNNEGSINFIPFVVIVVALIILLYFLYGQKKLVKIDDDDLDEIEVNKSSGSDFTFAGAFRGIEDDKSEKQAPPVFEKPDFSILDKHEEIDPDETVYYDGDPSTLSPDELLPEIDFAIDYPVFKEKEKERFLNEEEDAIDSVVRDISFGEKKNSTTKIEANPDADKIALEVARKRLMEIGNVRCRNILNMLESGLSQHEIANQEGVSVGDVELVNRYLKIK